ncbi:hypothetical protein TWF281_009680 [Arthrobotrys megalospora]
MNLPLELWFSIFSNLPHEDVISFSLSCKAFRNVAVPVLFRSIRLCEGSLAAFKPGGSLDGITLSVRHFTFEGVDPEICETVRHAQRSFNDLSMFSNITSIRIKLAAPSQLNAALPSFMLEKLAECPWYGRLKSLDFESANLSHQDFFRNDDSSGKVSDSDKLTESLDLPQVGRFWKDPSMMAFWDYSLRKDIIYPPALEELKLKVPERIYLGTFKGESFPLRPSGFVYSSANSLRNVNLHVGALETTGREFRSPPQYPNVNALAVYSKCRLEPLAFEELVYRFPNVESLDLSSRFCSPISAYSECRSFERLKRMRGPWPTQSESDLRPLEIYGPDHLVEFWGPLSAPPRLEEFEVRRLDKGLIAYITIARFVKIDGVFKTVGQNSRIPYFEARDWSVYSTNRP